MAKSYIHQNSSFPFWVKNGLVVSRTLLRAAGWWQRQNSLSAQAHSAVNCLLCRTGWASQDQSSRAQSTSTAVTAFHPWCYHLHWPKASDPHCFHSHFIQWEHLWLLCYPPQKKKKRVSTKLLGCEASWDHYPAVLCRSRWPMLILAGRYLPAPEEGLHSVGVWDMTPLRDTSSSKVSYRRLGARAFYNHRITKVRKDLIQVQQSTYHQYFPTKTCPLVQYVP